ncbi:MAG: response regulator transcription factor [Chloroflexi bacterium]|nr:response regulator transcription factor [Chloroflexota bacterium]
MSPKKYTILVADDDPHLLRLVRRNLELASFRVCTASDGDSALKVAEAENPDLLVLDIMMPSLDGYEVCRRVREFSVAPIIMLTAKDAEEDKVLGLDVGADDYLTKPFSSPELLARVRAALRRAKQYTGESPQPIFTCAELTVDFAQHLATLDGRSINLTPTEYRILSFLARNAGRVVTQQDLLSKVWGPEYKDEAHLLRVNIARLRRKVEPDPHEPRFILTRSGIGYTLVKAES